MAVLKPLLTEFGIHHRLESCALSCYDIKYDLQNGKLTKQHQGNITFRKTLACRNFVLGQSTFGTLWLLKEGLWRNALRYNGQSSTIYLLF